MNRDTIWIGIIAGLVIPFVGYAVLLMLVEWLTVNGVLPGDTNNPAISNKTLALLAICLNLLPLHFFRRRYQYNSMRGIVFPTMGYVVAWMVVYGRHLIGL